MLYFLAMTGILLMLTGTFLEESSTSIGKISVRRRLESPYSFGFISTGLMSVMFLVIMLARRHSLVFDPGSIPLLVLRIVLEAVHATITLYAITRADRSTFGFIRTLTIPTILGVDLVLGYALGWVHVAGILLIVGALLYLFLNHGLTRRGAGLALASAFLGAATTSLFKYSITNFNSTEIDQAVVNAALTGYFLVMARLVYGENAVGSALTRQSLVQSLLSASGGLAGSYAYLFAPASVIMAARRAMAVFWSVLSGRAVFHERRLAIKLAALFVCAMGLSLLAF